MKIVRMWDKETRGSWNFAMVETREFVFIKRQRRIARASDTMMSPFRFMDNGEFTPGYEAERLWRLNRERELTQEEVFARDAQAAYLVGK